MLGKICKLDIVTFSLIDLGNIKFEDNIFIILFQYDRVWTTCKFHLLFPLIFHFGKFVFSSKDFLNVVLEDKVIQIPKPSKDFLLFSFFLLPIKLENKMN